MKIKNHETFLNEWNVHFKDKEELSAVYMILNKYGTDFNSTDVKIANLLNNAYLYELVKEGNSGIILDAIEWKLKEEDILKNEYPQQEEEFNSYISCLNEYKEIIETTEEIGFSYYSNLVIVNSNVAEDNLGSVANE